MKNQPSHPVTLSILIMSGSAPWDIFFDDAIVYSCLTELESALSLWNECIDSQACVCRDRELVKKIDNPKLGLVLSWKVY